MVKLFRMLSARLTAREWYGDSPRLFVSAASELMLSPRLGWYQFAVPPGGTVFEISLL
jgi:hypothetical protein